MQARSAARCVQIGTVKGVCTYLAEGQNYCTQDIVINGYGGAGLRCRHRHDMTLHIMHLPTFLFMQHGQQPPTRACDAWSNCMAIRGDMCADGRWPRLGVSEHGRRCHGPLIIAFPPPRLAAV